MSIPRLAFVALLASACRSSADPLEDFAEKLVQVRCDGLRACCTSRKLGFDAATCRADYAEVARRLGGSSEGLVFNPAGADACLEQYQVLPGCLLRADPPQCPRIRTGTLPEGAECTLSLSDACIEPEGAAATCYRGVCTVTLPVPRGAECADWSPYPGSAFCEPNARCLDGRCADRLAAGQPCLTNFDCLLGLTCHSLDKKCSVPAAVGASCSESTDCKSGICQGARCLEGVPIGSSGIIGTNDYCLPG